MRIREERRDLTDSPMKKAPTPTEKFKKQRDNIKNATKTSITQRFRTDLGGQLEKQQSPHRCG